MKDKRALILTSVASMVQQFLLSDIKLLQGLGYEVHVACNFLEGNTCSQNVVESLQRQLKEQNVQCIQIDFSRKMLNFLANLKAYKEVKAILIENQYTLLHCHSPIGGVIGRLSARNIPTKVIYTAHGFHFYKGAPLLNWILYYPIEKFCSRFTDVLITINREDYTRAKKKMKAERVEYIPGVGVDVEKFANITVDRVAKRQELGIGLDDTMLISVGELNKNKNHQLVIRALAKLSNKNIHYFIAGIGPLEGYLKNLIDSLGLSNQVHLLGFRNDIGELYKCADIFCFPSFREGLSVALMEAMACGLPIVASRIRGNVDLLQDKRSGYLVDPVNVCAVAECIDLLYRNECLREGFARNNEKNSQKYERKKIKYILSKIFESTNK